MKMVVGFFIIWLMSGESVFSDSCLKAIYQQFVPSSTQEELLSYLEKPRLKQSKVKLIEESKLSDTSSLYKDDLGRHYLVEKTDSLKVMDEMTIFNTVANKWKRVDVSSTSPQFQFGNETLIKPMGNLEMTYSDKANRLIQEMRKKTSSFIESKWMEGINALLDNDFRKALAKGVAFKEDDKIKFLSLTQYNNQDVFLIKSSRKKGKVTITGESGNQIAIPHEEWEHKMQTFPGLQASGVVDSKLGVVEAIQESYRKKELFKARKNAIASGVAKLMFYPTIAPFKFFSKVSKGRRLDKVFFDLIKEDGAYIAGYVVLAQTETHPLIFLEKKSAIAFGDFISKTDKKGDGITVYIDGIPKNNSLADFGKYDYGNRVEKSGGKTFYYRPTELSDIKDELISISRKYGKISRLEILGHGLSGEMEINQSILNSETVKNLKLANVFKKNGQINLISCRAGSNTVFGNAGEIFMVDIGKAFLSEGGTVTAATKNILVESKDFPTNKSNGFKNNPAGTIFDYMTLPFNTTLHMILQAISIDNEDMRTIAIP